MSAAEIRERFARINDAEIARNKIRRPVDLGKITEATKIAESIGVPITRGEVVSIVRGRTPWRITPLPDAGEWTAADDAQPKLSLIVDNFGNDIGDAARPRP